MKKILVVLLMTLAIVTIYVQANADSILPPLPSHKEFLKEMVKEGRMTPEEARRDLQLAEESRKIMEAQKQKNASRLSAVTVEESGSDGSTTLSKEDGVDPDLAIGTVFAPKPAKRKIAGTERSVISAIPLYSLHDGEYLIPLIPQAILNGIITKNGYYYTVTGVEKNFFKLLFKKKYTSEEAKKILEGDNPPFLVQ